MEIRKREAASIETTSAGFMLFLATIPVPHPVFTTCANPRNPVESTQISLTVPKYLLFQNNL
jgi:hypothetical protein